MTLDDAKAVAMSGPGGFGIAYPLLDPPDRDALREWFVTDPAARPRPDPAPEVVRVRPVVGGPTVPVLSPAPQVTGDLCPRCGGFMVQTGTCKTCHGCGESSGGCG